MTFPINLPRLLVSGDSANVIMSKTDLSVDEDGNVGTEYTVHLNTAPTARVTVTLTSSDSTVATPVSSVSLTFEADDMNSQIWSSPQTVTVTGVDDDIDNDVGGSPRRTASLTHAVTSREDCGGVISFEHSEEVILLSKGIHLIHLFRVIFIQFGMNPLQNPGNCHPNGSSRTMKMDTDYPVISPDTEFGMGWRFEGLQTLYGMKGPVSSTSSKIMLVYGNFKFLIFERNMDGTYTSPEGDYSILSFIPEPFGGYSRTTKTGANYLFDRTG